MTVDVLGFVKWVRERAAAGNPSCSRVETALRSPLARSALVRVAIDSTGVPMRVDEGAKIPWDRLSDIATPYFPGLEAGRVWGFQLDTNVSPPRLTQWLGAHDALAGRLAEGVELPTALVDVTTVLVTPYGATVDEALRAIVQGAYLISHGRHLARPTVQPVERRLLDVLAHDERPDLLAVRHDGRKIIGTLGDVFGMLGGDATLWARVGTGLQIVYPHVTGSIGHETVWVSDLGPRKLTAVAADVWSETFQLGGAVRVDRGVAIKAFRDRDVTAGPMLLQDPEFGAVHARKVSEADVARFGDQPFAGISYKATAPDWLKDFGEEAEAFEVRIGPPKPRKAIGDDVALILEVGQTTTRGLVWRETLTSTSEAALRDALATLIERLQSGLTARMEQGIFAALFFPQESPDITWTTHGQIRWLAYARPGQPFDAIGTGGNPSVGPFVVEHGWGANSAPLSLLAIDKAKAYPTLGEAFDAFHGGAENRRARSERVQTLVAERQKKPQKPAMQQEPVELTDYRAAPYNSDTIRLTLKRTGQFVAEYPVEELAESHHGLTVGNGFPSITLASDVHALQALARRMSGVGAAAMDVMDELTRRVREDKRVGPWARVNPLDTFLLVLKDVVEEALLAMYAARWVTDAQADTWLGQIPQLTSSVGHTLYQELRGSSPSSDEPPSGIDRFGLLEDHVLGELQKLAKTRQGDLEAVRGDVRSDERATKAVLSLKPVVMRIIASMLLDQRVAPAVRKAADEVQAKGKIGPFVTKMLDRLWPNAESAEPEDDDTSEEAEPPLSESLTKKVLDQVVEDVAEAEVRHIQTMWDEAHKAFDLGQTAAAAIVLENSRDKILEESVQEPAELVFEKLVGAADTDPAGDPRFKALFTEKVRKQIVERAHRRVWTDLMTEYNDLAEQFGADRMDLPIDYEALEEAGQSRLFGAAPTRPAATIPETPPAPTPRFAPGQWVRADNATRTLAKVETRGEWDAFLGTWKYKVRPGGQGSLTTWNETGLTPAEAPAAVPDETAPEPASTEPTVRTEYKATKSTLGDQLAQQGWTRTTKDDNSYSEAPVDYRNRLTGEVGKLVVISRKELKKLDGEGEYQYVGEDRVAFEAPDGWLDRVKAAVTKLKMGTSDEAPDPPEWGPFVRAHELTTGDLVFGIYGSEIRLGRVEGKNLVPVSVSDTSRGRRSIQRSVRKGETLDPATVNRAAAPDFTPAKLEKNAPVVVGDALASIGVKPDQGTRIFRQSGEGSGRESFLFLGRIGGAAPEKKGRPDPWLVPLSNDERAAACAEWEALVSSLTGWPWLPALARRATKNADTGAISKAIGDLLREHGVDAKTHHGSGTVAGAVDITFPPSQEERLRDIVSPNRVHDGTASFKAHAEHEDRSDSQTDYYDPGGARLNPEHAQRFLELYVVASHGFQSRSDFKAEWEAPTALGRWLFQRADRPVKLPASRAAVDRLLALTSAGEMDTALWSELGWSFEGFLRFSQLPATSADAHLRSLQEQIRRQLEAGASSASPGARSGDRKPSWTSPKYGEVHVAEGAAGKRDVWHNISALVDGKRMRYGYSSGAKRWARKEVPPPGLLLEVAEHGYGALFDQ